ncbi:DNA-binding transcriptional regulator, AcrR family [Rhodococcus jostii]|uniref:DNA-binding transcriptional regulator, AcrR family n=1 Tax=Rhodococcus jostii TaxID=132919 RepID=A0A1H5BMU9_RHOJO|nr:DNA-binding transcriptional regulator, AcrR family [Rhodococcus jostii]
MGVAKNSRQAMIDAAERIVAERGMTALTLKDVQDAAGQANKSAAKYHFGSREGLIDAVVEARMSPVNERRQALLNDLTALGTPPTARQAIEALIRPLAAATLGRPDSMYARFLVQVTNDPALAEFVQKHLSAESFRRVRDLIVGLARAPHDVAGWRVVSIINLSLVTLARWEKHERTEGQTEAIVSDLVDTCVAVLEAPSTARVSVP